MTLIKFAYVGEFTSRRRRVGVGEFARRRVDRIPVEQKPYECMSCRPDMSSATEEYEYISVRSA